MYRLRKTFEAQGLFRKSVLNHWGRLFVRSEVACPQ